MARGDSEYLYTFMLQITFVIEIEYVLNSISWLLTSLLLKYSL